MPVKNCYDFHHCFTLLGYRTKTPLWPDNGGDVTVVVVAGAFVVVAGAFVVVAVVAGAFVVVAVVAGALVVVAGAFVVTLNYTKTKQFNFLPSKQQVLKQQVINESKQG